MSESLVQKGTADAAARACQQEATGGSVGYITGQAYEGWFTEGAVSTAASQVNT